jgi:hypothetical protein
MEALSHKRLTMPRKPPDIQFYAANFGPRKPRHYTGNLSHAFLVYRTHRSKSSAVNRFCGDMVLGVIGIFLLVMTLLLVIHGPHLSGHYKESNFGHFHRIWVCDWHGEEDACQTCESVRIKKLQDMNP